MDVDIKVKEICEQLKEICELSQRQGDEITTEATTITVLILPFLQAFGYDTGNPSVYAREFTSDNVSNEEKVDIALFKGKEQKKKKEPMVLIECKTYGTELQRKHTKQLFRYFSAHDTKIAVLTNGTKYEFYSDLKNQNKMDPEPFFEFDICKLDCDKDIDKLKEIVRLFSKEPLESSSPRQISERARKFNDTKKVKEILAEVLKIPSDSFVRFFVDQIYDGRKTRQIMEYYAEIVRKSCEQVIGERVDETLKTALASRQKDVAEELVTEEDNDGELIMNQEEIDGYNIVKAILYDCIDISRVVPRNAETYCPIFLDDNNRKTICRLKFKNPSSWLGLVLVKVNPKEYEEVTLESVNDIYKYADRLKQTVCDYDNQK